MASALLVAPLPCEHRRPMTSHLPAAADPEALRASLARERERVRALQEIALTLGSTLDLNELLAVLVEQACKLVDADRTTLYLVDEDSGELWTKLVQGGETVEIRMRIGEGLAGWVARTGKPLNIKDAYLDPRFDSEWDKRTGQRTRSTLCVPVRNLHGRIIGVFQVSNKREGWFGVDDEMLLGSLASQAAVSIENTKLFLSLVAKNMELLDAKEQLERKIRELDVLFEISQVAASATRLDELLEGVLARTMRAIDAEAGSILLAEDDTGDLRFRAAVGGEPEKVKRLRIEKGRGISGWVAQHGQPQIVNDVDADPRHSRDVAQRVGYHPRSLLCVPLRWKDGVGALELLNKGQGRGTFDDDDLKFATVIAGHVSNAISLAKARERREREERLSAIGGLLSSVLHDLKTPMTVIQGYTQLLVTERDPEVRRTYAEAVQRQVRFVGAMTREVLAFARGERTLLTSNVYLHRFFDEVKEQLERELSDRGVRVVLDLRDRGVAVFDQHKLERAIHNLGRNAAEAMGPGGGTFTITVSRRDDGALLVACGDDGPGIPEEIRGRLFESFATHGKASGTGLGLAIVQKIVEDHGGSVSVESAPGRTVFTLVLPQPPVDRKRDADAEISSNAAEDPGRGAQP
jgi:signal transduction histidine kinase